MGLIKSTLAGLFVASAVARASIGAPSTRPSVDEPATRPVWEFYVSGDVIRTGIWNLGVEPESVLSAIDTAELKDENADYSITVIHRIVPGKLERTTTFDSLKALRGVPDEAPELAPNDIVEVKQIRGDSAHR